MLDVLSVYERPYDPNYPVVCLDEKLTQLTKDIRVPLLCKSGKPQRLDYEYKRNGTCNLFVAVEPKEGKRVVRVTKRRAKKDYASFVTYLVMKKDGDSTKTVLVEDNVNRNRKAALTEQLGP